VIAADLARGRLRELLPAAAALLLATVWLGPGVASAVDLEKLVMPGPVIRGHADVEAECRKCHAPFRTEEQRSLCLDCHEAVGQDAQRGEGFHGRSPGALSADCRDCHAEHKGRDADVLGLDAAGFDHDLTDQPLEGAHRRAACDACHETGTKHRKAPTDCHSCHRDDDVHQGRLGTACDACHVERAWAEARFDHASTHFPLEGRHDQVDCSLCHPGERYENTATDCNSCHRLGDVHRGRFGARCESCHVPGGWTKLTFDHDRDTKFPLRGGHRGAACAACHRTGLDDRKLSSRCADCHQWDDVHHGRNGSDCERCHGAQSWTTEIFDHQQITEFPLRGAHRGVKCQRCHTGTMGIERLDTACSSCHREDDVHGRQEGGSCDACHNETAWTHRVFFEHDLTDFPLLGMHAVAACEQCHATPRYKDAPRACIRCHSEDDEHAQRLGPRCATCHNPNAWALWRFDHDVQTSFELRGAHEGLDCHQCHRVPAEDDLRMSGLCQTCHARDDRHRGAFGSNCSRCHDGASWREVTIP
jgi:hypothetical protein